MIRKVLAVILTIFTLYAIKETVVIFTSSDVEIASHRKQLILIALSITVPLVVLSLWLWRPKQNQS
ncbi:hypothetical protein [Pedobacter frigiditerrae]|uniref:hypothetical protein n=1 Tax=Pedobacter frigiditerrae TaxID=2530452 RepID=UPI00292E6076|nr:hypothetical protein [Pedobacter frigiditerrae]